MERGGERGKTENQKRGGQAKRWSERFGNVPHAEFVMDYYRMEHGLCDRQTPNRIRKPMRPMWLPCRWFCPSSTHWGFHSSSQWLTGTLLFLIVVIFLKCILHFITITLQVHRDQSHTPSCVDCSVLSIGWKKEQICCSARSSLSFMLKWVPRN